MSGEPETEGKIAIAADRAAAHVLSVYHMLVRTDGWYALTSEERAGVLCGLRQVVDALADIRMLSIPHLMRCVVGDTSETLDAAIAGELACER